MPRLIRALINALVIVSLGGVTWAGGIGISQATVTATVISTAQYPLALDVDADGNVWIGYADGTMTPKGVTVVPAASGPLFGVNVTAGVETRLFDLDGIQGIVRSPAGHLFVANESGDLYVATDDTTTVFGVNTTADALTLLDNANFFRGGLAMDSTGNLFGARKDWGGVAVLPAVSGTLYGDVVTANTPALLTPAGLTWGGWEGDLAVDDSDNLFVNTWYTNTGPQGVYVLPKAPGTLYGQSVDADTLVRSNPFNGVVTTAAGIDIDDSNNIYVSQYVDAIYALSPQTRLVMGQTLTANTATVIAGSGGQTGQGVAVAPDGSSLISGAFGSTRRLVPVPSPPVLSTAPVVAGVADVGETLTANSGTWSGDPTPTTAFQWQSCDVTGPAGATWLLRQTLSNIWNSVTWGGPPGGELFVAVAESGFGNRVMTSPDGITWTYQSSAADNAWYSVTWGGPPGGELFVAVSATGTGNRVMTSPDGITWTSQASAADNSWRSVVWGGPPGGELFVAVSSNGANRVMTSPDGITWTLQTSSNGGNSVTWGGPSGGELFVAVSNGEGGSRAITSPDGITWTPQTASAANNFTAVKWGGPSGGEVFVAVSATGTGNRVMTSPDGITWTSRSSAADNAWYALDWGGLPGAELFVAVAGSGSGNRVMTSPDGITWTSRASAANELWYSVAWGGPPSSRAFVALARTFSSAAVMTSAPALTCADIPDATGSTYVIGDSDRGQTLRVQVTATNIFGAVSAQSSGLGPVPTLAPPPLPPRTQPGPPRDVVAEPALLGATVRWSPPQDPGTDEVSLYAVRAWPGGPVCQVPASARSCSATGLDPRFSYYFTVVAMSGAGWGSASSPSNMIRPLEPEPPGVPQKVVATSGDSQATVSWEPPSSTGSSPIREYRATSSPTGGSCTSSTLSCVVDGLANGTAYTFTVEARNDEGWGPSSVASSAVTPQAASVTISGQRSERVVKLTGATTSIAPGSVVTVWWRITRGAEFTPGSAMVSLDSAGSFTWQRRFKPTKRVEIYATVDTVQSNSVVLPRSRSRSD